MHQKNYDVLIRNGKEEFVVIPKHEYEALLERVEDEADYRALQKAKKRNAGTPLIPHAEVVRRIAQRRIAQRRKLAKPKR